MLATDVWTGSHISLRPSIEANKVYDGLLWKFNSL